MTVKIQIKDKTGHWRTVRTVSAGNDQLIDADLKSVQKSYKMDVRAVDKNGSMINYQAYIK